MRQTVRRPRAVPFGDPSSLPSIERLRRCLAEADARRAARAEAKVADADAAADAAARVAAARVAAARVADAARRAEWAAALSRPQPQTKVKVKGKGKGTRKPRA